MNSELFVLCDAATEYQGRLNILGTFDTIWAQKIPVVYPQCALALRIRFSKSEEGKHKIKINIVDEDGKKMINPLEAEVNIQFHNPRLNSISTNMITNVQRFKLERYGEYAIDLSIDEKHTASLPLYVCEVPEKK